MAKFAPEDWQAELLRLTIFSEVGETQRDLNWWESITGEAPEEATSSVKKGTSGVHGPFKEGRLFLNSALDRIDLIYVANSMDEELRTELPTVGVVREALAVFAEIGDKFLAMGNVPEIRRMAFGAVLTHQRKGPRGGL